MNYKKKSKREREENIAEVMKAAEGSTVLSPLSHVIGYPLPEADVKVP